MGAARGNCWIALAGSVVKASAKQLRPAAREETCLAIGGCGAVNEAGEFSSHRFKDITNGKHPPLRRDDPAEEGMFQSRRLDHRKSNRQVLDASLG